MRKRHPRACLLHRAYHTLGAYRAELEAARRYRALAPDVTGGVGLEALRRPPNRSFALPLDLVRATAREMRAYGAPEAAGRVTERGIAMGCHPNNPADDRAPARGSVQPQGGSPDRRP